MRIQNRLACFLVFFLFILSLPAVTRAGNTAPAPANPIQETETELEVGVALKKECQDGDATCKADCSSKIGDAQKECLKLCEEAYQRCLAVSQNQP